jgi:uncharacterized protein YegP (UPF0339 family)
MKIEVFTGRDAQHYLRLVAENGETVLVSEGYTRRWSAKRAARKLQQRFPAITKIVFLD